MKVISWGNMPTKLPTVSSLLAYLYLDRFKPAQWVWAVVITLVAGWWLMSLYCLAIEESIEIFKGDEKKNDA